MIEVEIKGLDEMIRKSAALPEALGRELRTFFDKSAFKVLEKAQRRFVQKGEAWGGNRPHVRTNRLRSSLTKGGLENIYEVDKASLPLWAKVGTNVNYALAVEMGARPHEIKPVQKKALHFFIGAREIFAKLVHHPGSPPHPYLSTGLEESLGDIDRYLAQAGENVRREWEK